jgi:erythromycin esterase-like protein
MDRFRAELARAAVPIDSTAFVDLIADVVGARRLVSLGESHHFVHETYALRARVLQVLAGSGFSVAGFELARTDGVRLDDYLSERDPDALDRVGTFGYLTESDRPYTGLLAVPQGAYPTEGMRSEYRHLLDELRGVADTTGSWTVFGFDIDYLPGVAAERLATVVDPIERTRSEATLAVSHRYDAALRSASSYDDLREPMGWREQLMAEHVGFEFDRHPRAKFVLCGHNLHLGAANPLLDVDGAVGPGGGRVPPLGAALRAAGHDAVTIWMMHAAGVDSGPPPSTGVVESPRNSLNGQLAEVGSWFAIRCDTVAELAESWPIAGIYNTVMDLTPAEQCDVILFAAQTTALQVR